MKKWRILGLDMDYHGAVVEDFIKEFSSLEEAETFCRFESPIGVRYMVDKQWYEGKPVEQPSPYSNTIYDNYMRRGMI